jgi:hypothetical protein
LQPEDSWNLKFPFPWFAPRKPSCCQSFGSRLPSSCACRSQVSPASWTAKCANSHDRGTCRAQTHASPARIVCVRFQVATHSRVFFSRLAGQLPGSEDAPLIRRKKTCAAAGYLHRRLHDAIGVAPHSSTGLSTITMSSRRRACLSTYTEVVK